MPSLARLIDRGVLSDLTTLEPLICSMLWTSVATGRRADAHGILGDLERDEEGVLHLARSTSRRSKALWNFFHHAGLRSLVVGWPASHPAESIDGVVVSDRFHRHLGASPLAGSVHPRELEETISEQRLRPDEITAAHLAPFVPGLPSLLDGSDERLRIIATVLAESATVHAAATWLLENERWDFCAVHYEAIASLSRAFLRFTGSESRDDESLAYKDVVGGIYRFHDMMLGRLLELAGKDAIVFLVSDHGMLQTDGRSAEAHRARALLVAAGPGIREDDRIYGASLLDVAPTILALQGVAIGSEVEGRPLRELLSSELPMARGSTSELSREQVEPFEDFRIGDEVLAPPWAPRYNLARSLLGSDRAKDACTVLEELKKELPDETHFALLHAQALYHLGEHELCRQVLAPLDDGAKRTPMVDVLLAFLACREGRSEETVERLARAERFPDRLPRLHHEIGNAYLQMSRWEDAARAYRTALELDGEDARSHDGLAAALLELDRPEEAAREALHAVWLSHHFPSAHFHLGAALARMGEGERGRAIEAFETCLSFDEKAAGAHLWLARLYESGALDLQKALAHRARAQEILDSGFDSHGPAR